MERVWSPYCGAAPLPGDWLAQWNFDPVVLALLAGGALMLARARAAPPAWAALILLLMLFVSPLCALSSALFSARVVHHVVLTAIAAPLLAVASDRIRVAGSPTLWAAVHAVAFWAWHAPGPYALALSTDLAYWVMQVSLFLSAFGFWVALRGASAPLAIGLLLAMMVQMGLLGALITFAGTPLYEPHLLSTGPWGLTPLEDQQLAGIIMWAPASGLYLAVALRIGWAMLPAPPLRRPA